eukprot:CAMPEP_0202484532 /NCGR_PEP_ID=MMETSP1361-20130828/3605_1 /ASSEMBLY_ACC=CAM_ASM_000849 /TAXON_ID=210615 /ORGANISM="Staurosira complex sp., Strain CCMP2646" /LENGTH=235 /DNA_ID=CAMNT_0049113213 /DNA_START=95 /DNA_END=799 /DNA_ORIENTATION=-
MIQSVRPHRLSHPLTVLMYQSLIIKPRGRAVGTPFACCWQTLSFRTTTTTTTTTTSTTDATNTTRPRHGDSWNSKLKELEQFVKTNGHACVPQSHNTLGWWVHANRKEYKKFQSHTRPCWMTAERIQHLENAGFIWNVDKEKWMDGYEKLCHYQRQHGHCKVPRQDTVLGSWVRMNRQQYQKGKLTREQVELLNRIDFLWNLRDATWNKRLAELQEFSPHNGPGVMPSKRLMPSW